MVHKRDDYAEFQDRIFQEMEEQERLETQGKERLWKSLVEYAGLLGLSEDEVRGLFKGGLLKAGMMGPQIIAAIDEAGRKKKRTQP